MISFVIQAFKKAKAGHAGFLLMGVVNFAQILRSTAGFLQKGGRVNVPLLSTSKVARKSVRLFAG